MLILNNPAPVRTKQPATGVAGPGEAEVIVVVEEEIEVEVIAEVEVGVLAEDREEAAAGEDDSDPFL